MSSRAEIRKAFQAVLSSARPAEDFSQLTLFDKREEQIIRNGLVRLWYKPLLPFGGEKELALARTLEKLARDKEWAHAVHARLMGKAFRQVAGWYYIRVPKTAPQKQDRTFYLTCKGAAEERANSKELGDTERQMWRDRARFYEEYLAGQPDGVADFFLDCRFTLVKLDATRDRMVVLRNRIDKTKLIALDANSFTAPRDFKRWVENQGDFTWMTGEQELELLRHDVHQLSAYRRVYQVAHFGWHAEPKLWIASDGAIAEDGTDLLPDNDGVIWWGGLGYLMADRDWEGEAFKMGKPSWRLNKGLAFREAKPGEVAYALVDDAADDLSAIADLFGELVTRAVQTLGGYEGYLSVGAVLAFAAAPEFFEWQRWFAGMFLHGETGSGKSTFAGWLMRIVGFDLQSGVKLPDSSRPGLQICAQQYCNLPIWLEEFQDQLDTVKVEWLKSLYMREVASKKEFGERMRQILTNAMITGETTSKVAAMRQRFVHFQVSAKNRKGDHKEWFSQNSPFFFSLFRLALRRRKEFVARFFTEWKELCASIKVPMDERSKGAHALGYAALAAFASLFPGPVIPREDLAAFREWTAGYARRAAVDVREEVNVNVFWQLVVDAFRMGALGYGREICRLFRVFPNPANCSGAPPDYPNQTPSNETFSFLGRWTSYKLYIEPGLLLANLEQYLAKTRSSLPLRRRDLRDQLSVHPYWVPGDHYQRFPAERKNSLRCWCVDVDQHPLGLQPVEDAALLQAYRDSGLEQFSDPRKGPLFHLIEEYERHAKSDD